MLEFNGEKALQSALASGLGLPSYEYIMKNYKKTDVSKDVDFQRRFNGFYKIRRNEMWREKYYQIFEKSKRKRKVTFESILCNIYVHTDMVEPSFASKMLATINPDMPIWDSQVLRALGLTYKGNNASEKQDQAILLYDEIVKWYWEYCQTENARKNTAAFDHYLSDYQWLSDVKKIDYMLWAVGDKIEHE